jgi:hypothetical protein
VATTTTHRSPRRAAPAPVAADDGWTVVTSKHQKYARA